MPGYARAMDIRLGPRRDIPALAKRFAATGHVSIPRFLRPEDAAALHEELAGAATWVEIFRAGERVYEMPHAQFTDLSAG